MFSLDSDNFVLSRKRWTLGWKQLSFGCRLSIVKLILILEILYSSHWDKRFLLGQKNASRIIKTVKIFSNDNIAIFSTGNLYGISSEEELSKRDTFKTKKYK